MVKPKNPLSERQLHSKYEKYLKKLDKQTAKIERGMKKSLKPSKTKIDEAWKKVATKVRRRDRVCQLWPRLFANEQNEVITSTGYFLLDITDPAHIFSRGSYPHMKYDEENVVLLSRLFHSRIDQLQDPVTGESISPEERQQWWIRIVGKNRYDKLYNKAHKKEKEETNG